MRLLITGDRRWHNGQRMAEILKRLHEGKTGPIDVIIEGGARGADILSRKIAWGMGIPVIEHLANWEIDGKSARLIRNSRMLMFKPTLVIAFHNNLIESKGTKDMIKKAITAGLKVIHVTFDDEIVFPSS